MICPNCKTEYDDSSNFCINCGAPAPKQQNNQQQQPQQQQSQPQPQQQSQQQPQQQSQPQPQQQQQQQQTQQQQQQQPQQQQSYQAQPYPPVAPFPQALPMNWYKFLIYISLFASSILSIVNGIILITGLLEDTPDELLIFNPIIGILAIGIGIFAFYVRFRLSGFHKDGPAMLTGLYALNAAIAAISWLGVSILMPGDNSISSDITSICVPIAMIYANKTYFKKRQHLFVND